MKTLKTFLFSALLAIFTFTTVESYSQGLKGNGIVVKETRSVSAFEEIELNAVLNVFLKQGQSESVLIEADKNLIPHIKTYVKNDRLIIETEKDFNVQQSTKLSVYVSFRNIRKIENNSVGNVKSENQLDLSSLVIENNSVGNLDLDIRCTELTAEINSVGNVMLSGKVTKAVIENNAVGNLNAYNLSTDILKLESNSLGNSEVNASKEIYLDLNGMGNVTYKGNATVKSLNENGMGKVRKL